MKKCWMLAGIVFCLILTGCKSIETMIEEAIYEELEEQTTEIIGNQRKIKRVVK